MINPCDNTKRVCGDFEDPVNEDQGACHVYRNKIDCVDPTVPNLYFFNTEQWFTNICDEDGIGYPITIVIPYGTIPSDISVNEANRLALIEAQKKALAERALMPCVYLNDEQSCTDECLIGTIGYPITVVIPAGSFVSYLSKADANASAHSQACADAAALRDDSPCVTNIFYNTEQSCTNTCPDGTIGYPITVTVPAGTYSSAVSQEDANQQAIDAACAEASTLREATPCVTNIFYNTEQSYTDTCPVEASTPSPLTFNNSTDTGGDGLYDGQINFSLATESSTPPIVVVIPAGTYTSSVSQADANATALAAAQADAEAQRALNPCRYAFTFISGTWHKNDGSTGPFISITTNGPSGSSALAPGNTLTGYIGGQYFIGYNFYLFGLRSGFNPPTYLYIGPV